MEAKDLDQRYRVTSVIAPSGRQKKQPLRVQAVCMNVLYCGTESQLQGRLMRVSVVLVPMPTRGCDSA